jgi:lipoprotein-anchoring transpeptidase ErfK/SrfK
MNPATFLQQIRAKPLWKVSKPWQYSGGSVTAKRKILRGGYPPGGPEREKKMAARGLIVVLFGVGLILGGCMQSTIAPPSEANLTPRDKKLLAAAPYEKPIIPDPFKRHIVTYNRKEEPGTIVIDSDARYLYYVLPGGKAIRYGVTVGEQALAWSGVAKVGRMAEWPSWTPTPEIKKRLDVPNYVGPGPQNPMGARAMYLYENGKDTLYRIHGTNQPEYIGQAISSGCIRMTNENVIDLYKRVKPGTVVVVLAPHDGGTSQVAGLFH